MWKCLSPRCSQESVWEAIFWKDEGCTKTRRNYLFYGYVCELLWVGGCMLFSFDCAHSMTQWLLVTLNLVRSRSHLALWAWSAVMLPEFSDLSRCAQCWVRAKSHMICENTQVNISRFLLDFCCVLQRLNTACIVLFTALSIEEWIKNLSPKHH